MQPPVAAAGGFGQVVGQPLGVVEAPPPFGHPAMARLLDLLRGQRSGIGQGRTQGLRHRCGRLTGRRLHGEQQGAAVGLRAGLSHHPRGDTGIDQPPVQQSRRLARQRVAQQPRGRRVSVPRLGPRRDRHEHRPHARPFQHQRLGGRRFGRRRWAGLCGGLSGCRRQGAEILRDGAQRLFGLEGACDDQGGVVRPIVTGAQRREAGRIERCDLRQPADRRPSVALPGVEGPHRGLDRHTQPRALCALHLVADRPQFAGHLRGLDRAACECARQPSQVPALHRGIRCEAGDEGGAVVGGRRVGADAALGDFGGRAPFAHAGAEDQVLEQMHGPAGAGGILQGAGPHRELYGHDRLRRIGHQQDLQPVGQPVLADAVERAHRDGLHDRRPGDCGCGRSRGWAGGRCRQRRQQATGKQDGRAKPDPPPGGSGAHPCAGRHGGFQAHVDSGSVSGRSVECGCLPQRLQR